MANIFSELCGICFKPNGRQHQNLENRIQSDTPESFYKGYFFEDPVTDVASIDDDIVLLGSAEGDLCSYNIRTGTVNKQWSGHKKAITKISLNLPNSFFTSSRDLTVSMWDVEKESDSKRLYSGQHELVISAVVCQPNEASFLCTGARDNTVALWDVSTGKVVKDAKIARNLVTDLCWKGQILAQTSEDKSMRVWDPRTLQVVNESVKKQQILTSCDISGNEILTSSGGVNGVGCELTLWDFRKGISPLCELKGHTEKTHKVCYVSTEGPGKHAVSVAADHSIKIWDLRNFTMISSFNLTNQPVCIAQICSKPNLFLFAVGCFSAGVCIVSFNPDTKSWNLYE